MQDLTGEAKLSADTVINEDTGAAEIKDTIQPLTAEKMAPEVARKKVEQFMKMRDMLQSKGLAFAAGDPQLARQFKMEQWEFDWYCEVYADVVAEMGEIPKWVEIILAEAFILGPKIKTVLDIRKEANEARRLAAHQYRENPAAAASATVAQREDFKKRWQVDENGFFTHTEKGQYIPQGKRKERPVMNQVNYDLLVKHNGADFIQQVFQKQ